MSGLPDITSTCVETHNVSSIDSQTKKRFEFSDDGLIGSRITLPCGRVVPNRFVKVALYEHLATFYGGLPNTYHFALYSKWAEGRWGMIVTGNYQVSPTHLSLGRDVTFSSTKMCRNVDAFRTLAKAMQSGGSLAVLQMSHSGRQSPRFIGGRLGTLGKPISPSSRRLGDDTKEGIVAKVAYALMFQRPRIMSRDEILEMIDAFVDAARVAFEAGFDGVQLHAAHGYILSQFLSPKLNTLDNEYSNPLLLIEQLITRIRAVTSATFILGIKLNAGDYVTGGVAEDEALEHVKQVALMGVDYIEVTGGDYENPVFGATTVSPRQAFFSSFSRRVVQSLISLSTPTPLILLTGGLRTPSQFSTILQQKHAHLLGIGRLSVLCPDLPLRLLLYDVGTFPVPEPTLYTPTWFPKLLGAGVGTAFYTVGMRQLAKGKKADASMGSLSALFWMWAWTGPEGFSVGFRTWFVVLIGLMLGMWLSFGR